LSVATEWPPAVEDGSKKRARVPALVYDVRRPRPRSPEFKLWLA
jgi:hypothetical protein